MPRFARKYLWWIIPLILVVLAAVWLLIGVTAPQQKAGQPGAAGVLQAKVTGVPECPADLSGILTAPLMDPQYIAGLIPLGNINPPSHTSPVDHVYFDTAYTGKIPLYAPADARIMSMTEILYQNDAGEYEPSDFVLSFTVCRGLILDLAGYTGITPQLRAELDKAKPDCIYGVKKEGHDKIQGQCHYQVDIPVTAGQELGYTQVEVKQGQLALPFEIWAANYNVPARADVNWDFYRDDRYAHIMCLFDLYAGDLKDQYYEKFGYYNANQKPGQTGEAVFIPRTVEPRCGQVNQDLPGTIQGMWYAGTDAERNLEAQGKGLAFVHNNIDPTMAEVSIGGFIRDPMQFLYPPRHTGLIDRDPSEITADGQVYCFDTGRGYSGEDGIVLVQLVDDHHLLVEYQPGDCTGGEQFIAPAEYQR
jgi:hypothetical protein